MRFQKRRLPCGPLFRRVHRARKIDDVRHFVRTIYARSFQYFRGGFVSDGKWKRPQALGTGQNDKGFAVMVCTIARNPDGGVFSLVP